MHVWPWEIVMEILKVLFFSENKEHEEESLKESQGKALEVGWLFNDQSLSWQKCVMIDIRCANISSMREVRWTTWHKSTRLCYISPEGTLVIQNLNSVLNSGQWKSPREFNPDKFLNSHGEFVKPEAFMPFSAGMTAKKPLMFCPLFLIFFLWTYMTCRLKLSHVSQRGSGSSSWWLCWGASSSSGPRMQGGRTTPPSVGSRCPLSLTAWRSNSGPHSNLQSDMRHNVSSPRYNKYS